MANNKLYGSHYIERQRSSGYKSTTYAMAEIVDNSVDADANDVKIVLSEKEKTTGQRIVSTLDRIFFLDNGSGMTPSTLNSCLTFSEGIGRSNSRIGAFGVGLPNSSIATCKRVDVYSRTKNQDWHCVFLDVDDQLKRSIPGYDPAIKKEPNYSEIDNIKDEYNTIIVWSKLDKIDVSKAKTLIHRSEKLLGRIYRYKISNGLRIRFEAFRQGKKNPIIENHQVLPYDPLFVTTKKNYITDIIWKYAYEEDNKGKTPDFAHLEEFNSMYYYRKFVEGCSKNGNKALFQKLTDYWDVPYSITLNGQKYQWKIRASFAHSSISNPGVRSGGATKLGQEFGKKMSGDHHFKSGNIYFIRAGREIDFGNFGLYTVTDEKNRFWTIEIHFDSDLDELMGLSNNKQSVQFKYVKTGDLDSISDYDEMPLGAQREHLYAQISEAVKRSIGVMRKHLSSYATEFKRKLNSQVQKEKGKEAPIPEPEPVVIQVIPKEKNKRSEDEIEEITKYLKEKFMSVSINLIRKQVENYANGLTRTIVLYAPNETLKLFELTEKRGNRVTLINTNHIYYKNIVEPLKSDPHLKVFAIAIEMLIGSAALEMDRLIQENDDKYKQALDNFLIQLSSRLNEFISDSGIIINPQEFVREFIEEIEPDN